jgi:hypothetical protein
MLMRGDIFAASRGGTQHLLLDRLEMLWLEDEAGARAGTVLAAAEHGEHDLYVAEHVQDVLAQLCNVYGQLRSGLHALCLGRKRWPDLRRNGLNIHQARQPRATHRTAHVGHEEVQRQCRGVEDMAALQPRAVARALSARPLSWQLVNLHGAR